LYKKLSGARIMAYTDIDKPTDNFRIKLYAGNAGANRAITWDETNTNMQPDMLWFKSRTDGQSHCLFDSIRGAVLRLIPNSAGTEGTENTNLDSFDTNGFQVDAEAIVNGSSRNYVTWGWKAGTSFSNSAGANGADIASSGTVNAAAGFSIIIASSDGAADKKIAHGLGAVPDVIWAKNRVRGYNWDCYFKTLGYNASLILNTDSAARTGSWGNATFTSAFFQTKEDYSSKSGEAYVYYCFAEKKGYSKFGSYIGNGNADGPFIYTGFKPAWVMVKPTSRTGRWRIKDNKRDINNVMDKRLSAESSDAEGTGSTEYIDFLSNGFKARASEGQWNGSGEKNIYIAFAENPFVTSTGVPTTAR